MPDPSVWNDLGQLIMLFATPARIRKPPSPVDPDTLLPLLVGAACAWVLWQQLRPRLMARRQPWSAIGLEEEQVDKGDHLLDWRYALHGQQEQVGLRYVHLFDHFELEGLAAETGFRIEDTFESDGRGGRLGLYQIWKKS